MKIAISAEMPDLAAQVAQRFGISSYLIIVDSETMEIEALPNPGAAGKQAAGMTAVFSGNALLDTLFGTGLGSILAGNPLNSYVIGGELLQQGVSLYAVTAFIAAWVTIGLVQLPAEMAALGKKFALIRNTLSMVLCIAISILTVVTYYAFSVWDL